MIQDSTIKSVPETAGFLGRRVLAFCVDKFVLGGLLIILAVLTFGEIEYVLDLPRSLLWYLLDWLHIGVNEYSLLLLIGPDLLIIFSICFVFCRIALKQTPGMMDTGPKERTLLIRNVIGSQKSDERCEQ